MLFLSLKKIERWIEQNRPGGKSEARQLIYPNVLHRSAEWARKTLIEIDRGKTWLDEQKIDDKAWVWLAGPEAMDIGIGSPGDFIGAVALDGATLYANERPIADHTEVRDLRDARVIQTIRRGRSNLLDRDRHGAAAHYVQVAVDLVRFAKRGADGKVRDILGHYLRIGPTSGRSGSVVFPISDDGKWVLMARQYRHVAQAFLTETPRGFPEYRDRSAAETARRELKEEVWADALRLIRLGSLYTDTGQMEFRPTYFLAVVDRSKVDAAAARHDPVMENPVWIATSTFFEAVWSSGRQVSLSPVCCQALYSESFPAAAALDQLHIEDAFTVTAALMAVPHLMALFPELAGYFTPEAAEPEDDT